MPLKQVFRQITIKPLSNPSEADKGIFFPRWDCFCCEDTGTVTPHNMNKMCSGYHLATHPMVACIRKGCYTPPHKEALNLIEEGDCEDLHQACRQEWLDTVKYWRENREKALAQQAAVAAGIASVGGGL